MYALLQGAPSGLSSVNRREATEPAFAAASRKYVCGGWGWGGCNLTPTDVQIQEVPSPEISQSSSITFHLPLLSRIPIPGSSFIPWYIQYLHLICPFPYICFCIQSFMNSFMHAHIHPSVFHSHSMPDLVWLSPSMEIFFYLLHYSHFFSTSLTIFSCLFWWTPFLSLLYKCGWLTFELFLKSSLPHPPLALLSSQLRQLCNPVLRWGELTRVLLSHWAQLLVLQF